MEHEEMLKHGNYLLNKMHEEWLEMSAEDDDAYIADAEEGWVTSNYDMLCVIWALGDVAVAYEAIEDDVDYYVANGHFD